MKRVIPLIIAVMMLIPAGYAISYQGNANADIPSEDSIVLSVDSFVLTDGDYIHSPILTAQAGVTKSGSTYTLSATNVQLTPNNLYLKISAQGYSGNVNLSCSTAISGVGSCSLYLDGNAFTTGEVSQGYHSLRVTYSGSYSGSTMPLSEVSVEITATYLSEGSMNKDSSAVRLKATSSASVLEILEESNPDIVEPSSGYSFSDDTAGTHGNNYPAANISNDKNNQGGIADNQGHIDVELTIPSGPQFVIYLTTNGNNTFHLIMYKGEVKIIDGTVTFNAYSGYYFSSKSYDGSQSGYFYTSINQVNNHSAWMSGDGEDIRLIITTEDGQTASRNLKMDIVFKKE